MKNEDIASTVAEIVYKPKKDDDNVTLAVQLLVEKLCIPNDIEVYSYEDVKRNILWHLNTVDDCESLSESIEWMRTDIYEK